MRVGLLNLPVHLALHLPYSLLQVCFAWNRFGDAQPLVLVDGHWDVVFFGFGDHPASGRYRWTLDRWRSVTGRLFYALAGKVALLEARARHEVIERAKQRGKAAEEASERLVWPVPRVVWHTIPAPPVRKDGFSVLHGDGRTLQRIRAMNELASEALYDAMRGEVGNVKVVDLWALTLPIIDMPADSVHYDAWVPYQKAVLGLLFEQICT